MIKCPYSQTEGMRADKKLGGGGYNRGELRRLVNEYLLNTGDRNTYVDVQITERQRIDGSDYNTDGRNIYYKSIKISLTQTELDFMKPLIENPGTPMSLDEIVDVGHYRPREDYHVEGQFLYRIRQKFAMVTGKRGTDIISRSQKKYRFNPHA